MKGALWGMLCPPVLGLGATYPGFCAARGSFPHLQKGMALLPGRRGKVKGSRGRRTKLTSLSRRYTFYGGLSIAALHKYNLLVEQQP